MDGAEPQPDLPRLRPLGAERATNRGRDGIVLTDPLGLAEPTFVPRELLPIAARLDGSMTAAAIAAAAGRDLRQRVPVTLVEQLIADLDARGLLLTTRYVEARDAALQTFRQRGVRAPQHAGSAGYPREPAALARELAAMIRPAPVPRAAALRGLVAPHIDLQRGRDGYAAAYGQLLAAPPADRYVVFGTGHAGPAAAITGLDLDWQTPLGTAATDREFVARVHAAIGQASAEDVLLHRGEHSIEFQVLMLQHVAARRGAPPPRIAAFLCGSLPSADGDPTREDWLQRLLAAFVTAERAGGGATCYIAGADLAHLGPFFGDGAPVDAALLQRLERDERARLAHLANGDPGAFHQAVHGTGNPDRVCSAPAITLTALLAGGPAELLHYGQAASPDGSQIVSFCAAAFAGGPDGQGFTVPAAAPKS